MWKYLLKAILYVSSNPVVRQWAQRKARKLIDGARDKAEGRATDLADAVGIDPPPPAPPA